MLQDNFGRAITYPRISVTHRSNLRCVHCMPRRGLAWLPRQALLTYEEIAYGVAVAPPGSACMPGGSQAVNR